MRRAIWSLACSPVERACCGSAQSLGSAKPVELRRDRGGEEGNGQWAVGNGEDEEGESEFERGGWKRLMMGRDWLMGGRLDGVVMFWDWFWDWLWSWF